MVYTDAGEDLVVSCPKCKYAANLEKATSRLDAVEDYADVGDGRPVRVHTPGMKTIEDVARFLGVSPKNKMKTLALMATDAAKAASRARCRWSPSCAATTRSTRRSCRRRVGTGDFRPMHAEEIQAVFGSPAGFLGPIGSENWALQGHQGQGAGGPRAAGPQEPDRRRQPRGLPPAQRDAAARLSRLRGNVGRPARGGSRRGLSQLRHAAQGRQGGGDRAHLQARLQVLGIDGRARARQGRQGSYAHHGHATASASSAS